MYLHKCGFIHRDVKPENFRVKGNKVFLIDFGLCAEYMKEGKHIDFANGIPMKGTPYTASIFSHQSQQVSRRDDLISLMYSLMRVGCPEVVPFHNLVV